jgi:uncharacterized protein with PQ loop repeat
MGAIHSPCFTDGFKIILIQNANSVAITPLVKHSHAISLFLISSVLVQSADFALSKFPSVNSSE